MALGIVLGSLRVPERALMQRISRELQRTAPKRAEEGTYDIQAAVALMLRPTGEGLEFLAIKRAEHDRDPWSGHMALPGGRREGGDTDLKATAVRETLEEVGVDLETVGQVLGQLDDVYPRTRRIPAIAITPFLFAVDGGVVAETSTEVEHAVWVPLNVVVAEEHKGTVELEVLPGREFPTIEYSGHVIWGLTLAILRQLEGVLNRVGFTGDEAR